MPSGGQKVRENRLRRVAARRGLRLSKSRSRDPWATDYGVYWIEIGVGTQWRSWRLLTCREGVNLDQIEAFLETYRP